MESRWLDTRGMDLGGRAEKDLSRQDGTLPLRVRRIEVRIEWAIRRQFGWYRRMLVLSLFMG